MAGIWTSSSQTVALIQSQQERPNGVKEKLAWLVPFPISVKVSASSLAVALV